MTTGEKIKALRKKLNLTQEAFADSIKVSRRSIMDWEHDKYTPQTESIMEICKVYNLDLSYFIEENKISDEPEIDAEEKSINVIKNNILVSVEEKEKYKKEIINKYKIHKWYRLFAFLAILTPIIFFIIGFFNDSAIDYLIYPLLICPIVFYILFKKFRDHYSDNLMDKLHDEVCKYPGAIQYDFPLYVRTCGEALSFYKRNQLLLNVSINDIKKIVLFLNNTMMNELLPTITKKVYFIKMYIYYNDGNKSVIMVNYNIDDKLNYVINDFNKRLLIEFFNKIYIKYKK